MLVNGRVSLFDLSWDRQPHTQSNRNSFIPRCSRFKTRLSSGQGPVAKLSTQIVLSCVGGDSDKVASGFQVHVAASRWLCRFLTLKSRSIFVVSINIYLL